MTAARDRESDIPTLFLVVVCVCFFFFVLFPPTIDNLLHFSYFFSFFFFCSFLPFVEREVIQNALSLPPPLPPDFLCFPPQKTSKKEKKNRGKAKNFMIPKKNKKKIPRKVKGGRGGLPLSLSLDPYLYFCFWECEKEGDGGFFSPLWTLDCPYASPPPPPHPPPLTFDEKKKRKKMPESCSQHILLKSR